MLYQAELCPDTWDFRGLAFLTRVHSNSTVELHRVPSSFCSAWLGKSTHRLRQPAASLATPASELNRHTLPSGLIVVPKSIRRALSDRFHALRAQFISAASANSMMYRTDLRASSGWRHFDRMGLKLGPADMELGSLMQHNAEAACRARRPFAPHASIGATFTSSSPIPRRGALAASQVASRTRLARS